MKYVSTVHRMLAVVLQLHDLQTHGELTATKKWLSIKCACRHVWKSTQCVEPSASDVERMQACREICTAGFALCLGSCTAYWASCLRRGMHAGLCGNPHRILGPHPEMFKVCKLVWKSTQHFGPSG